MILLLALSCALAFAQLNRQYLHPPPAWPSIEQMHTVYVEKFTESSGFGLNRLGHGDLRNDWELVLNEQPYVVQKVELIGLVKHPEPTAYVMTIPPQKRYLTNNAGRFFTTRALTTFETDALVQLRSGRNEIVGTHDGSPAILGTVRAQKKCLKCHDGNSGNMLGAFSYSMALSAKPAIPALTNSPAQTNLAPQFSSR